MYYMQPKTIVEVSHKNLDFIKKAITLAISNVIPQKDVIESCLKQEIEPEREPEIEEQQQQEIKLEEQHKDDTEGDDMFMNPPKHPQSEDSGNESSDTSDSESDDENDKSKHTKGYIETHKDREQESEDSDNDPVNTSDNENDQEEITINPSEINLNVSSGDSLKDSLSNEKTDNKDTFFFSDSDSDNGK